MREVKKTSHVAVIIYVILAIVIIIYAIYLYFAMRNGLFPFTRYVLDTTTLPPDYVQPNGNVAFDPVSGNVYVDGVVDDDAKISEDERATIKTMSDELNLTICNWYCASGKNLFPIPNAHKILGDCTCEQKQ